MLGQPGQEQQQGQQQQFPGGQEQRPQSPENASSRSASAPGAGRSTIRTFHGPNFHMTMTTSSGPGGLFPRNANGPQQFQQQPDQVEQMMAQMFSNIGVFGNGPGKSLSGFNKLVGTRATDLSIHG
jgi:E3 ubiquitin-protein ligase RNF115/126